MVVAPIDAQEDETEEVAQKRRKQPSQRLEARVVGDCEVQDHDGDNDGKDIITESLHAVLTHSEPLDETTPANREVIARCWVSKSDCCSISLELDAPRFQYYLERLREIWVVFCIFGRAIWYPPPPDLAQMLLSGRRPRGGLLACPPAMRMPIVNHRRDLMDQITGSRIFEN